MPIAEPKLAVLVPDGAYESVMQSLLAPRRAKSLQWNPARFVIVRDSMHDASPDSVDLLRVYQRECSHALVLKDLEGSGWEGRGAAELETSIMQGLRASGWREDRALALVVEPEIEAWLRFGSAHMKALVRDRATRRKDRMDLFFEEQLETLVARNGGWLQAGKPCRPKESFAGLLEVFGIQRSNALYAQLAERESLRGCGVASFVRFVETLQRWFPIEP